MLGCVVGELRVDAQSSESRIKVALCFCTVLIFFSPCSRLFCTFYVHEVLHCVFFERERVFIVSLALGVSVGSFSLDC